VIVLLVIDMQAGLFGEESPRHDAEGVVDRITWCASGSRRAS